MNGAFLSEFREIGTTRTRIRFGKTRTGTGHTWEYYQEKFQAYHTDGGYAEKNASSYVTVEKNKEEGCRKGRHYPVRLIANGRWTFILPFLQASFDPGKGLLDRQERGKGNGPEKKSLMQHHENPSDNRPGNNR